MQVDDDERDDKNAHNGRRPTSAADSDTEQDETTVLIAT